MSGAKTHDYHIVDPSPNPLIGAIAALLAFFGGVMMMHPQSFVSAKTAKAIEEAVKAGTPPPSNMGEWVLGIGVIGLMYVFYAWWSDVIKEAHKGDHTPVVSLHLRYGMILFIASEVMFFVGWFWSWFDFSLFPQPLVVTNGAVENLIGQEGATAAVAWPPKGIEVIDPFGYPLLNTLILLCSGTTVTWAHHALLHGDREGLKKGLWATIALGILFTSIQIYEYVHAPFPYAGLNYGAAFYMATGFHGFHVFVGTIFLIVCLARAYKGHFTPRQHFGFEAAAWYWHFVDVVWLFLFVVVYVWGSWGAQVH